MRHTLDVIHMEKNVASTLMDFILGKSERVVVTQDLYAEGIMHHLHLVRKGQSNNYSKPHAPYVLTRQERRRVLQDIRGASHYGRPNREAVEVSGQTLLRVQQNGLKIGNKIFIFKHSAGHSVKPPKAESKVQTFGNGVSRPLKLDGHSVKPPKAKSKVQTHIIYQTSIHFFF